MYIWIIFGVLISALILFFVYSAIKDKRNKKKIREEKALFEAETVEYYDEILVTMNEIIDNNEKFLKEFQVSIGKYKMGQITDATRNIISEILTSTKFKGFFNGNEQYVDLVRNMVFLKDLKSNNWQKKATGTIDYFKTEYKKLTDDKVVEVQELVRKEINQKYHDEFVK